MVDQYTMASVLELIKTNPDQAAAILAQSGITPDQVFAAGAPQLGAMVQPQVTPQVGILNNEPRIASAGFTPGPAVLPGGGMTGANSFTPAEPSGWRDPQSTPVPFTDATKEIATPLPGTPYEPPGPTAAAGPQVAGATQTGGGSMGDVGTGSWMPTVTPEAGGGSGFNQADFAKLMMGAGKAMTPSDTRPIMNAGVTGAQKAPDPQKITGGAAPISQNVLLQLLMAQKANPTVPSLGSLIRG